MLGKRLSLTALSANVLNNLSPYSGNTIKSLCFQIGKEKCYAFSIISDFQFHSSMSILYYFVE